MFDPVRRPARCAAISAALFALFLAPACVQETSEPIPGNLLVAAKVENSGVPNTSRLVDGELPVEGDHWDTAITARFENAGGSVTWDLGTATPIRCALLQGDNNDIYTLSGSADGKAWTTLWQAGPVDGAGMRTRQGQLDGNARFLRITGKEGDQLYSIGEIAAFSECPKDWPKIALNRVEGVAPAGGAGEAASSWSVSLGVLVAAAVVLMVLSRKRRPPAPAAEGGPAGTPPPPAP
jgi:hypothetical protein